MKVKYDEKADAMYIRFSESPYFESDEIKDGIIVDYDKDGKVIGFEILDVSDKLPKGSLSKISIEPPAAKHKAKATA